MQADRLMSQLQDSWRQAGESAAWYGEDWTADQVRRAPEALDRALERWRDLYRAALAEYVQQGKLAVDTRATRGQREQAARRQAEARNQLKLLRNEDSELGQTDFYSYRYLASEGFLPGYSFPRLPLAAFIPGTRRQYDRGDYLQRPRFLAISEFGPGALIYHEGARYVVDRVQLPRGESGPSVDTEEARRCHACGYHHPVGVGVDVCDCCGERLGAKTYGLLRLQTVFTKRRERISSDEEERRRSGFELEVSYRFADHGERPGRVVATAEAAGRPLLHLEYGDSATLRIANVGRRRRKDPDARGYWLDLQTGRWLSEKQASDAVVDADSLDAAEDVATKKQVIPYVTDRRNIAVVRLAEPADDDVAITVRYALERGAEALFQLEDSELGSEVLPEPDRRGRFLLMESAEGGAGALRRLVEEPDALARVARQALAIAHFDPDTGADLDHAPGARERCEKACYDCLLAYGNQIDHASINRHAVRDLLLSLGGATTVTGAGGRPRSEQRGIMAAFTESSLERRFLDWLDAQGLRLPDRAQVLVAEAGARPDFVYDLPTGPTAVFVDGPPHDSSAQRERDAAAEERLIDAGWHVVRVRHDADWDAVVAGNASVFGRP